MKRENTEDGADLPRIWSCSSGRYAAGRRRSHTDSRAGTEVCRRSSRISTRVGWRRAGRMSRRKAERKKRRRRNILVVILLLLLLVAAYAGAKIWVAVQQWENKAEKSDFTTSDTTDPEEDEIINVAVFGTDEDGVRADVNMVASFNTGTKELHFISVPRDSKVIMTKTK